MKLCNYSPWKNIISHYKTNPPEYIVVDVHSGGSVNTATSILNGYLKQSRDYMRKYVISLQNTNLDRKLHNFAIAYRRSEVYLNEKKGWGLL
jgi:hypothetical protein